MIFEYRGESYPEYLRQGNACQFIEPIALQFCQGSGLDVGCGNWPLRGAIPIDWKHGGDAMGLPPGPFDFVFSSHCLEHLNNPIEALEHWKTRLRPGVRPSIRDPEDKPGGVLFLYLPHPDMTYWKPQHCRRHLHSWTPEAMAEIVSDLGFVNVIHSGRDMAWSFSVVGFVP